MPARQDEGEQRNRRNGRKKKEEEKKKQVGVNHTQEGIGHGRQQGRLRANNRRGGGGGKARSPGVREEGANQ
jgi:predicted metal-dependent phosphoesterase TrpH